jgi:hypothetical protein
VSGLNKTAQSSNSFRSTTIGLAIGFWVSIFKFQVINIYKLIICQMKINKLRLIFIKNKLHKE